MNKIISILTTLALTLFLFACNQDMNNNQSETVKAPNKEAAAATNSADDKEREISPSELPDVIKMAIQNTYAGAEMLEADEVTRANGSIYYDVEIRHKDQRFELMYESDGTFLGIEEEGDDGDDDDDDDDDGE